mgnify:CR=1 FL=1
MWNDIARGQNLSEIARCLMEQSGDGFLAVDQEGTIFYCNESFLHYLGMGSEEVLGQNVRRLLHEVLIFNTMEHGESRVDTVGLLQRPGASGARAESGIHLISRYAVPDRSGRVYAGVLHIQFRERLLEKTKKLYASFTDTELLGGGDIRSATSAPAAVGGSPSFLKAKNLALRSGGNDFPVLITGETGTGKEVIANLVHSSGKRADGPFVKLNCAAIPAELLESELFGYEPGAFTGASRTGKKGKFEQADGGSIFLDEIGDMPLTMQAKLLRVLQEKEVERVGGDRPIPVNVRIISATRRDLQEMIQKKEFREDLFFRLNVINIHLAPLRERKEDILPLATHFLNNLNFTYGSRISLPSSAAHTLGSYSWPGNVRELNNVIQSAYAQTDGGELDLATVSLKLNWTVPASFQPGGRTLSEAVAHLEREMILDAMERHGSNMSAIATELGIPRSSLYNKLKRYGIRS